jgi:hypothetical protein
MKARRTAGTKHNWSADTPFPLTPALSPRERESQGVRIELSHAPGFADRLARILPLPKGEGWGEGEWSVDT